MNCRHLLLIPLAIAPIHALADMSSQGAQPSQSNSSATPPAQTQPAEAAPTPSSSVGEFVRRTVVVARLQAEDEVHYETRRQVRGVFDRILQR